MLGCLRRAALFLGLGTGMTLASHAAMASQIVKNGGAIVAGDCYLDNEGNIIHVYELLDFYEGSILRGWTYDLGLVDDPVEAKVDKMLSRLESIDQDRAAELRQWWQNFDRERAWLSNGARLPKVDDIGAIRDLLIGTAFAGAIRHQKAPAS